MARLRVLASIINSPPEKNLLSPVDASYSKQK